MKNSIILILIIFCPIYSIQLNDLINLIIRDENVSSSNMFTWKEFDKISYLENDKTYNKFTKQFVKNGEIELASGEISNLLTELVAYGDSNNINSIKIKWVTNEKFGDCVRELLLREYGKDIITQIYLCDTRNISNNGAYHSWVLEVLIRGKKKFWLELVSDSYSQGFDYYGVIHLNESTLKFLSSYELCENEYMMVPASLRYRENESNKFDTLYNVTINEIGKKADAEKVVDKIKSSGLIEFGKKYPKINFKNNNYIVEVGLCDELVNAKKISNFLKSLNYNSSYKRIIFNDLIDERFYQCPHIYLKK